ncbi:glyoxylase-like metal-dependent hydrolase (beta-lactamase superfamily II) [Pullulanibacillus pueri]|uniref:Putative quorum-quenching lactonase YtnP n=1 Tax=Pullulanibacillus pueri TaxID=1437324 RepID=A0A8J3ESS8_9BACL|nr:MBL fold metallo-hydrolase [Pullulanibacillus pueri]MBM7684269.1 glyoxylase-like metal-dependent hydrolase (beta-lactamase superfamily II) [Pullulanibacillus pueri]GGH89155.1 putative quorum-quenching lactonase YtnP [Pullulanibacillus pueri]
MEQLKLGEWTLTWLDGGVTNMDGGAMFGVVPKPLWSKKYPVNDKNQIELRTDPILIQGKGKNLLVESGIGNNKLTAKQRRNYGVTSESKLDHDLAILGLTTQDIDEVLMTHMHFDHALGLTKYKDDILVPTFENACIWTSQVEWDEMREPNIRSRNTYWEENWKPIQSQVRTFTQSQEVSEGIVMHHTGGHSDGHSVLTIESGGEYLIHMADLMPTHAHFNVLWVLAYDDYPMTSIKQKEIWLPKGIEKNAWFSFYHDAFYRAVKFDEKGQILENIDRLREEV